MECVVLSMSALPYLDLYTHTPRYPSMHRADLDALCTHYAAALMSSPVGQAELWKYGIHLLVPQQSNVTGHAHREAGFVDAD